MPEYRGPEQGDVAGPLERSSALGMVAAETRLHVAAEQAAGILPWVGAHSNGDVRRLRMNTKLPAWWSRKVFRN